MSREISLTADKVLKCCISRFLAIATPTGRLEWRFLRSNMIDKIKHLLIGAPLATQQLIDSRLNKIRALAAFSPDAFSSIGLTITALLIAVALSYFQNLYGCIPRPDCSFKG